MRIQLPSWVYRNLELFKNCALPNTKYTKEQLVDHLSHRMKRNVRIRSAIFKQFNLRNHKITETTYYVAEL